MGFINQSGGQSVDFYYYYYYYKLYSLFCMRMVIQGCDSVRKKKKTSGGDIHVNLGDINSHLLKFEQSLSGEENVTEPLAKSMLTMMVCGLFTKL